MVVDIVRCFFQWFSSWVPQHRNNILDYVMALVPPTEGVRKDAMMSMLNMVKVTKLEVNL